ncbi:SH3 domain-containing protein [Limnochorda pilosa]|uniref:SH3b domain-containing protein n=1 Tax=Limnochorda pilosa TaxID=1555112 RepID=A0A0K2SQC2_LIMPI|nr:SH3 domain-containing protein [Limnochorda pilosa]BAS29029.1 hypothetical protein LIP_3212 [Limnochorda pilosa]
MMVPARSTPSNPSSLPPAAAIARERLLRRRQRRAHRSVHWVDVLGWAAVILFVGWLVFLQYGDPSLILEGPLPVPGATTMVVTGARVNVREAPDLGAAVIGQVVRGDRVAVRDSWGGWYRIVSGGPAGWMHGDFLEPMQGAPSSDR